MPPSRSRSAALVAALAALAAPSIAAAEPCAPRAVRVQLPSTSGLPTEGNLAVYWMLPGEVHRDERDPALRPLNDFAAARRLLERVIARGRVDLGRPVDVTLSPPPGAVVLALFDPHHRTLDELLDGPRRGDGIAAADLPARCDEPLDLALAPFTGPDGPAPERCAGERDRLERVIAPEVTGSLGAATERRLCVHLPADYASGRSRYPVVYVLPGLSGQDSGGSVARAFRAADEAPLDRAAIVVGVNIATPAGASYLERSPATGDLDRYLAATVPAFVDGHYRTLPRGEARALLGQSTGGFDAISFALRHAEVFGAVAASSPDGLDLAAWLVDPDGRRLNALARDLLRMEDAFGPPGQMASYAADWSPDASARWGYAWPADPASGAIVPSVFARWIAHSPSVLLARPDLLASARAHLAGRVYLAAGTADEFGLYEPTRRFSDQLARAGIAHVFASDAAGHEGPYARRRDMVAFLLDRLARDAAPSTATPR